MIKNWNIDLKDRFFQELAMVAEFQLRWFGYWIIFDNSVMQEHTLESRRGMNIFS